MLGQKWAADWGVNNPEVSPNLSPSIPRLKDAGILVHGVVGTADVLAPDALGFKDLCGKYGVVGEWLVWEGLFPWSFLTCERDMLTGEKIRCTVFRLLECMGFRKEGPGRIGWLMFLGDMLAAVRVRHDAHYPGKECHIIDSIEGFSKQEHNPEMANVDPAFVGLPFPKYVRSRTQRRGTPPCRSAL